MEGVRLATGTDALGVEGRRRRGRPRLRWEDCVKKHSEGVEWQWRMRARNRGEWKLFVETVVKTGLVMEKGGKIDDRYRYQPNPGLHG